jgi:hypothetical protein
MDVVVERPCPHCGRTTKFKIFKNGIVQIWVENYGDGVGWITLKATATYAYCGLNTCRLQIPIPGRS